MNDLKPQEGPQTRFVETTQDIVFFGGGASGGKALRDDQLVRVPSGWVRISELNVGDVVITPKNTQTKVTGVFPQGEVELYKVKFSDGRESIACKDHLWYGWEAKRPSRKKIKTTEQLIDLIKTKNWLIPLSDKIESPKLELPIHPYVLGCVLGDGNISQKHCSLTTSDSFIADKIRALSDTTGKFNNLSLEETTFNTRFIPDAYKNSCIEDRLNLIQGLMDTDGYVSKDGELYYYTCSLQLANDFKDVIRSLGGCASISEKTTKLNDVKYKSYSVRIKYVNGSELVSLPRKLARTKVKNKNNSLRIKSIEKVDKASATCISIEDEDSLFLTNDYIVTHNTWCILFDNLRFVHDPNYFSVFFRKTTTELETNLWPEAVRMYTPFLKYQSGVNKGKWIGKAKIKDKQKEIIFPSGAKTKFAFLELNKHADSYYGAELSRVYWDEFQQQSEYAFHVLRSRLRSRAKIKSQMRMTLNPDSAHFCYFWIKPFLDEEGFPIREYSGRTRYFLLVSGDLHSSWDRQELIDKFPSKNPQTYTYVPSTLEDNKIMMELEPDYIDTLDSMPPAKRKQLLLGCWAPSEDEGILFQRGWLKKITKDKLPSDLTLCRGYDLAFNAPTDNNKFPDYTYGMLMGKSSDGFYYILGGHRMRESIGARNQLIIKQLKSDISTWGSDVTAITAVDPAGGQVAFQEFSKQMVENGIRCSKDVIPNNKSKRVKYEPFSDACQNGLVYICEDLFDREELELLYKENELFDGVSRSTTHRKDDSCDSLGMTFNYLANKKTFKVFHMPDINAPTKLNELK